jgi:hypothetical protein
VRTTAVDNYSLEGVGRLKDGVSLEQGAAVSRPSVAGLKSRSSDTMVFSAEGLRHVPRRNKDTLCDAQWR